MRKLMIGACLAGAALMCASAGAARDRDNSGIKVGTLSCHEQPGFGLIVGSSRGVRCEYSGANGTYRYRGDITTVGLDVGYRGGGDLVWAVFAPTDRFDPGALAGHYGGLTAGAAVGVGAGANALIGGSNHTFTLQPVSVEGRTGLEASAGIGGMTLHPVRGSYEPS